MIAKLILVNQIGPVMTILAVSWVMALGIAPLLAPPYMSKFKPYFMSNTQAGLDRMMARDTSSLITILAAVAGLGFLLNGILKVKGG